MRYKNNNQGFTILEIAVSMTIISVGMLGVLALINQNIKVEDLDKNKILASQLAQEGLEVVRNVRDYNWLIHTTPTDEWKDGIIHDGDYTVDYRSNVNDTPDSISASSTRLYRNSQGFYDHDSDGEPTSFSRIIRIDSESSASTSVTCLVQWKDRGNTYEYVADTVLYNWR